MWEGIVGPSDAAWQLGTARFSTLPDCMPDFGGELTDRAAVEDARARVGELTSEAAEVTDLAARAALYGQYVAACATCHGSGC